jgi:hypothetical protein
MAARRQRLRASPISPRSYAQRPIAISPKGDRIVRHPLETTANAELRNPRKRLFWCSAVSAFFQSSASVR